MKSVKILKYGLTEAGRIYSKGEVVYDPSPELIEMAKEGSVVEFYEEVIPETEVEKTMEKELFEPRKTVNISKNKKGKK